MDRMADADGASPDVVARLAPGRSGAAGQAMSSPTPPVGGPQNSDMPRSTSGVRRLRVAYPKGPGGPQSEAFNPAQVLESETAQIGQLVTRLHWTALLASGIDQLRINRFAIRAAHQDVSGWASKVLASTAARKRSRGSHLVQLKVQSMVTLVLYLRDLSEELISGRVRDLQDFNWQKHLRSGHRKSMSEGN